MDKLKETIETVKISSPPLKQFIDDIRDDIPYIHNCCKTTRTSLHNGQRKLFNSLLYFITKYGENGDICIYVGSSPGQNISGVAELFPNITFYLYDTYRTTTKKLPNVEIFQEKFTPQNINQIGKYVIDGMIKEVQLQEISHRVLFFSDLRTTEKNEVTESVVANDLNFQRELVQKLKPKAFSLKFRIPFLQDGKKTTVFEYFDGFGLIQPYARLTSNEIRLMNETKNLNNVKIWSLEQHENRMFYINTILREWARFEVKQGVIGGDSCFDCALEEMICSQFLKKYPYRFELNKPIPCTSESVDVSKMRNWISNIHSRLNLVWDKPVVQKTMTEVTFETPKENHHGKLPLLDRDVDDFLEITDPVGIVSHTIYERGNTKLTIDEIKELINKRKDTLIEAITHKSMDTKINYERLEFVGDRILSYCITKYLYTNYETTDISVLNGHLSAFTSGEIATELFAEKLGLKKIIIIHDEENQEKALEDVFEAFLAAINIIFDDGYNIDGLGMILCYKIIESILGEIDFVNFEHYIFPPKTHLKELFNEKRKDGWDFDTQFIWKIDDVNIKKGTYVESNMERITIRITPPGIVIPDYVETGPRKRVEKNACIAAIEFLKNRGIIIRPKVRDLGVRIKKK